MTRQITILPNREGEVDTNTELGLCSWTSGDVWRINVPDDWSDAQIEERITLMAKSKDWAEME